MILNVLVSVLPSNLAGAMLKAQLNSVCMQLRKNCNHPDLFHSHFEDDSTSLLHSAWCSISTEKPLFSCFDWIGLELCITLKTFTHTCLVCNFAVNYPPVDELVAQCAKFKLMDRLLVKLRERGHKVNLHLFPALIHLPLVFLSLLLAY